MSQDVIRPGKGPGSCRLIHCVGVLLFAFLDQGASAASLEVITQVQPDNTCYQGNVADVVELVDKAVALMDEQGSSVAFQQMMDKGGDFINGDLYVFVLDQRGTIVVNGVAPESIGNNSWSARDLNGHYFVRDILQQAFVNGAGWTGYHWYSPCTGKMTAKRVFFKRSGQYVVCAGFYNTLAI